MILFPYLLLSLPVDWFDQFYRVVSASRLPLF